MDPATTTDSNIGTTLTPAQIVTELDRYIVGQEKAKRAVAIALRNRWRRQSVPPELRDEVAPKNIIMIGPTGVGKTEVARRLAKLSQAPFLKVEASKYTEVGYVGRDVESMIRDLTELSVNIVKAEMMANVQEKAEQLAEERLLDVLLPRRSPEPYSSGSLEEIAPDASRETTKEKLRGQLRAGRLDERLDELDKIAGREGGHGPDVSRQGVQRDLLPIVEGSSVTTKYGIVRTDHILFIAAGAFHVAKPSDLIPELQGRFPIRVELDPLTRDDFVRILTEPRNALITQYVELLKTEQVSLRFAPEAVEAIAEIAMKVNESTENIGARRLYTVMEKLLEEISFNAPDMPGKEQVIDAEYVQQRLADITRDQDLSRYIL